MVKAAVCRHAVRISASCDTSPVIAWQWPVTRANRMARLAQPAFHHCFRVISAPLEITYKTRAKRLLAGPGARRMEPLNRARSPAGLAPVWQPGCCVRWSNRRIFNGALRPNQRMAGKTAASEREEDVRILSGAKRAGLGVHRRQMDA